MADKPSTGPADIIAASAAMGDIDGRAGPFSVSRLAHAVEQHATSRLIRPDGEYAGERGLTWAPLDRR